MGEGFGYFVNCVIVCALFCPFRYLNMALELRHPSVCVPSLVNFSVVFASQCVCVCVGGLSLCCA